MAFVSVCGGNLRRSEVEFYGESITSCGRSPLNSSSTLTMAASNVSRNYTFSQQFYQNLNAATALKTDSRAMTYQKTEPAPYFKSVGKSHTAPKQIISPHAAAFSLSTEVKPSGVSPAVLAWVAAQQKPSPSRAPTVWASTSAPVVAAPVAVVPQVSAVSAPVKVAASAPVPKQVVKAAVSEVLPSPPDSGLKQTGSVAEKVVEVVSVKVVVEPEVEKQRKPVNAEPVAALKKESSTVLKPVFSSVLSRDWDQMSATSSSVASATASRTTRSPLEAFSRFMSRLVFGSPAKPATESS
mmetsp:Transcript_680/g.1220  ORF Transcript_680/g.1220 Transcript_680/m.1220 type:complete len:297 (-) Transcript_680:243-1133(-)